MAKPEREFSADVGQKSMGVAGPDYIEKDFDKAFAMFDPNKNLPDGTPGGIGKENMQPGAVDDDVIGNREEAEELVEDGNDQDSAPDAEDACEHARKASGNQKGDAEKGEIHNCNIKKH